MARINRWGGGCHTPTPPHGTGPGSEQNLLSSRKGNDFAATSTTLVGKHCSKLENEPLSKRVAATRFPVNSNRKQQCDIRYHKPPSKSKMFPHQCLRIWAFLSEVPHL